MQQIEEIKEFNKEDLLYKRVDIIIPAYNEEERIKPVIKSIISFIEENKPDWRIIIALDGNDRTEEIIREYMKMHNYVFISRSNDRSGKGSAIKRASNLVNSDFVILMDADDSISFMTILSCIKTGISHDLTIFSRYLNSDNKIPLHREIISRGFNMLLKVLLKVDINDTQSGYKIIKADVFKKSIRNVSVTNTFFDVDLLYYLNKNGATSVEIPTKYNHSEGSKFNPFMEVVGQGVSLFAFLIRHSSIYKYIPSQLEKLYYAIFLYI